MTDWLLIPTTFPLALTFPESLVVLRCISVLGFFVFELLLQLWQFKIISSSSPR